MLGTRTCLLVFAVLLSITVSSHAHSEQVVFRDGKVYADIDSISYERLFELLAKASHIKISVVGDLPKQTELYSDGMSLNELFNSFLPKESGLVFTYDDGGRIQSITVFGRAVGESGINKVFESREQDYLMRQLGQEDQDTIDIFARVLSGSSTATVMVKLTAIDMLRGIANDSAATALEKGLVDADPQVRLESVKAIYAVKGDDAIVRLTEAYYSEPSPQVKVDISTVLQQSEHVAVKDLVKTR